jgi:dGTPase
LREFLYKNIYFHKKIEKINNIAVARMEKLFELYVRKPELMGDGAQTRIETEGVYRAAADYVAGMTDRYAMHEYKRHFRK